HHLPDQRLQGERDRVHRRWQRLHARHLQRRERDLHASRGQRRNGVPGGGRPLRRRRDLHRHQHHLPGQRLPDRKSTRLNSSHVFPYTTLFRSAPPARPTPSRRTGPRAPTMATSARETSATARARPARIPRATPERCAGRRPAPATPPRPAPAPAPSARPTPSRSEEHTSELQSRFSLHDALPICTTCPTNAFKANGTACTDDGNVCTRDICNGASATCTHPAGNAGTVCRAAAGPCDAAETCTGTSTICPANAFQIGRAHV